MIVKTVETGHATVHAPMVAGGEPRKIGTVTREAHGSTRSGVLWIARDLGGRERGSGTTRAAAARRLVEKTTARR